MPQVQLPIFPVGTTVINSQLAFSRDGEQIVYFNGHLPVFTHAANDLAAFRVFTTQLIINGTASYGQIVRAFGVPMSTVKRYAKKYRAQGLKSFLAPAVKRKGSKLTPERLVQAQAWLDEGRGVPEISAQLGVLPTTLHKAIDGGRLRQVKKNLRAGRPRQPYQQERAQRDGRAGADGHGRHAQLGTDGRRHGHAGIGSDRI
jgi:transposase